MKKHFNPPTEVGVFNTLIGVWQAAKGSIIAGTVLNIVTEYAITQHLLSSHLEQFFKSLPAFIPMCLAGLFVLFLAKERIRYSQQLSKMIIDKQARELGVVANLAVFVVFLAVFGGSIALSYLGSVTIVNTTLQAPELSTTTGVDTTSSTQIAALNAQFKQDSTTISRSYGEQAKAIKKKFNAQIVPYETKLRKGAKWLRPRIDSLYRERDMATAKVKEEQTSAILDLSRRKVEAVQLSSGLASESRQLIVERNRKAESSYQNIASKAERYLPLIIISGLIMIFLGAFIDEKFKYKSGIKEVVLPNEFDLLPSILSEYTEAFKSVFHTISRRIALYIKSFSSPASEVTDNSIAELVRVNMDKYKEKIITLSGEDTTPATMGSTTPAQDEEAQSKTAPKSSIEAPQERRAIGYILPPKKRKKAVSTRDKAVSTEVEAVELFNTYRIARRDLKSYQAKERTGAGKSETVKAGIDRSSKTMEQAKEQLQSLGYQIVESRFKLSIEKL